MSNIGKLIPEYVDAALSHPDSIVTVSCWNEDGYRKYDINIAVPTRYLSGEPEHSYIAPCNLYRGCRKGYRVTPPCNECTYCEAIFEGDEPIGFVPQVEELEERSV